MKGPDNQNNRSNAADLYAFSGLLLAIYRSARELPAEQFQEATVRTLKPLLRFDSGMWGTGRYDQDGVQVHSLHLHEQPEEMVASWEAVSREDVLAQAVVSNFGTAIRAHTPTLLREAGLRGIYDHACRFRMMNCMATGSMAPGLPVVNWISLFRADEDRQYSEEERALFQALFPHLVEALTINRLIHLDAMYTSRQGARAPVAIVDRKGLVYNTDGGFEQALRAEWPDWTGRQLPRALIEAITPNTSTHYRGKAVQISAQRVGDLFFLKVRPLGPVDRLTKREKEIAERFAQGLSHKEIAKLLDLAPATVRNYIQTIYGKLGVSDKAALASLMVKSE